MVPKAVYGVLKQPPVSMSLPLYCLAGPCLPLECAQGTTRASRGMARDFFKPQNFCCFEIRLRVRKICSSLFIEVSEILTEWMSE
jgi:hypothetical protein